MSAILTSQPDDVRVAGPSSSLRVERFTGSPREWDDFARAQHGWTSYHLSAWWQVMRDGFGHETVPLAARDAGGRLRAVLPLVRVRTPLFGHYLVSMPFLNYGGPLGDDAGIRAVAAHAVEVARKDGVKLLEMRSRHELPLDLPVSHRKITVVLDLPEGGDPEALWKKLGGKLRSQVRRPQKEGVTVRFGPDQVAPFYEVFAKHMRDLGTPALGRKVFEAVQTHLGDDATFGCAYLGDVPVAAGGTVSWGDETEIVWASALVEHKQIAPNMILYWEFMQRAVREGRRVFNFGRCTPGSGTHKFKLQWGSREEKLWWYDVAKDGGEVKTPSPDDAAYSWGPRLWKKLPLPVATALGPHVVRGIP